jgi:hypothetical protein
MIPKEMNDWPVFSITHDEYAYIIASPKDWQDAVMSVAERFDLPALVARATLLNATASLGMWGTPMRDEDELPMFSTTPGQSGWMINAATWAMDVGLAL